MPVGLIQVVLVLAPAFLALSILAYQRLRRHVFGVPQPVAHFRRVRWDSALILMGGVFMLLGAAGAHGLGQVAQFCGFVLAAEFFYVAYVNLQVVMSPAGLLMGMNYSPWRRFAGYTWVSERDLELVSYSRRRYRLRVPETLKADVQEIVDLSILK